MCEANVYFLREGKEELVMESVDKIEPEDDGLRLVNIFGDQRFVQAHIHAFYFVKHKILLKE